MGEKLLTTREVCEKYGVTRRTVMNWAGSGGIQIIRRKNPRGGRPKNYFDVSELEEYVVANTKTTEMSGKASAQTAKEKKQTSEKPGRRRGRPKKAEQTATLPLPAKTTAKVIDANAMTGADLPGILDRLKQAELDSHALWVNALDENRQDQSRNKPGRHGAAALKNFQDNWRAMVEARRKFEKDLPGLLTEHGRAVDVDLVCQVWSRLFAACNTELDQLGIGIAEACVGKSAGQIRVVIDTAVKDAKLHIRDGWEKIKKAMSKGE